MISSEHRDPASTPETVTAFQAVAKKPGQYTVFLVEDDLDDRQQIMRTLRESPSIYHVHAFESGDKLMEHFITHGFYAGGLTEQMPVFILLDLHLPGSSGMDILRELKEHAATSSIPVVMITGDSSTLPVKTAWHLQANAYIAKPVQLGNIHEIIYNGWGASGGKIPPTH